MRVGEIDPPDQAFDALEVVTAVHGQETNGRECLVEMGPRLGIAFEGCGCRAAFHVGALEWLNEQGVRFAAVTGASSGALIAGAAAINRVDDLRPAWSELLGTRVFDPRYVLRARWPFRMSEIVGGVAERYFGGMLVGDTPIPLGIVITQLRATGFTKRTVTARDPISVARAVRASCFIPGPYSRMVAIDRRLTFDGAWLGRVPVSEARQLGAEKIIACVSDDAGRLLRGALRAVPAAPPTDAEYRVLAPVAPLPIGTFDFDREATRVSFEIGRASAQAFVDRERGWLSI
jgi:predicted acylesterase/phospholipase RssA